MQGTIPLLVSSQAKQLLLNAEQTVQEECCENQCEHYIKGKRPGDCPSFRASTAGADRLRRIQDEGAAMMVIVGGRGNGVEL